MGITDMKTIAIRRFVSVVVLPCFMNFYLSLYPLPDCFTTQISRMLLDLFMEKISLNTQLRFRILKTFLIRL